MYGGRSHDRKKKTEMKTTLKLKITRLGSEQIFGSEICFAPNKILRQKKNCWSEEKKILSEKNSRSGKNLG